MSSEKRQRQPVHRGPKGPQSTWGDRDDCLAGSSPCHSVGLGGDGGHGMWGYRVWDVIFGYGIRDIGYETRAVGCEVWDAGYGIQDAGYGMQNLGYGMWNAHMGIWKYEIRDTGCWMWDMDYGMQDVGQGKWDAECGMQDWSDTAAGDVTAPRTRDDHPNKSKSSQGGAYQEQPRPGRSLGGGGGWGSSCSHHVPAASRWCHCSCHRNCARKPRPLAQSPGTGNPTPGMLRLHPGTQTQRPPPHLSSPPAPEIVVPLLVFLFCCFM